MCTVTATNLFSFAILFKINNHVCHVFKCIIISSSKVAEQPEKRQIPRFAAFVEKQKQEKLSKLSGEKTKTPGLHVQQMTKSHVFSMTAK